MPFCLVEASNALNQLTFHEWAARVDFTKEGLFQPSADSTNLLTWATQNGHLAQISHYFASQSEKLSKADAMRLNGRDLSALHYAAAEAKLPELNAALAPNNEKITKADLMSLNEKASPLGVSICAGSLTQTAEFLTANGEPLTKKDFRAFSSKNGKWTGFHDAACYGTMDQLQQTLAANKETISNEDLLLKEGRGDEVISVAFETNHGDQIFNPQFFAGNPGQMLSLYDAMPPKYRAWVDKDELLDQIERGETGPRPSASGRLSISAAGLRRPPVTIIEMPGIIIIIPDKIK